MKLDKLNDNEIISFLARWVKIEKKSTLKVLTFLAEADTRRLWLKEGYSSLFDFCVRGLRYSEGEAARRIQGCRTLSRFEAVKPVLERDELSLTGLCLLSPHLTESNLLPLLEETKNQTTRQVEKILEAHFPQSKKKPRMFLVEMDDELEGLIEKAKLELSENVPEVLLKRILKDFLRPKKQRQSLVKRHTRYVPKAIQRQVKEETSCTYLSPRGIRCNQKYHLQVDHIRPFAKGGSSWDPTNLRRLCRAHNLLLAKLDFPNFRVSRAQGLNLAVLPS